MTTEMWLIAAVRLVSALPVLRWPFYGAVVAIAVDQSDLFMMNLIELGGVSNYQVFDKYLDQAYMLAFLSVALRWTGYQLVIAAVLYLYRLAGFLAFELTQDRDLLLFFPNLFETWFLFTSGVKHFQLEPRLRAPARAALVFPLFALKAFQEYAIHYRRWLDGFTAVEAVEAVWNWLTGPLS